MRGRQISVRLQIALLFYCSLYTDYPLGGGTGAIARHVSIAYITCFYLDPFYRYWRSRFRFVLSSSFSPPKKAVPNLACLFLGMSREDWHISSFRKHIWWNDSLAKRQKHSLLLLFPFAMIFSEKNWDIGFVIDCRTCLNNEGPDWRRCRSLSFDHCLSLTRCAWGRASWRDIDWWLLAFDQENITLHYRFLKWPK